MNIYWLKPLKKIIWAIEQSLTIKVGWPKGNLKNPGLKERKRYRETEREHVQRLQQQSIATLKIYKKGCKIWLQSCYIIQNNMVFSDTQYEACFLHKHSITFKRWNFILLDMCLEKFNTNWNFSIWMKGDLKVIFSIRKSVSHGFIMQRIRNPAFCIDVKPVKCASVYDLTYRKKKMLRNNKL